MYEYFDIHSKHFVGRKNPFLFVFVLILIALTHTLIALAHTLIALAHTLIALALLNSTEKMRRLQYI